MTNKRKNPQQSTPPDSVALLCWGGHFASGHGLGPHDLFEGRVSANQYRDVLNDHLYPMIKHSQHAAVALAVAQNVTWSQPNWTPVGDLGQNTKYLLEEWCSLASVEFQRIVALTLRHVEAGLTACDGLSSKIYSIFCIDLHGVILLRANRATKSSIKDFPFNSPICNCKIEIWKLLRVLIYSTTCFTVEKDM